MSRLLACCLLAFVAADAVAAPVPKRPVVPQLEGTTWSGDGVDGPTTYRFDAGNSLTYSYGGKTYHNGTWKQDGASVYWETNGKYCEFEGTVSGGRMTGRAWNMPGGKWQLEMRRETDPKPLPPSVPSTRVVPTAAASPFVPFGPWLPFAAGVPS